MDEIVLALGVEGVAAREVVQGAVDLLEVPRVARIARDAGCTSVSGETEAMSARTCFGQVHVRPRVQQLEAVDDQVLVLADRDVGRHFSQRPAVPPPASSVEPRKPMTTVFMLANKPYP